MTDQSDEKPTPQRILDLYKEIAGLQAELDELLAGNLVLTAPQQKRHRRTKEEMAADRAKESGKLPTAAL